MKRDCTCKVAKHVHGTRLAYTVDKCRCEDCREAATAYERRRRRDRLYGRPSDRVPIEPVVEHIKFLMEHGVSAKQIAKISGVSHSAIGVMIWGRSERNGQRNKRVTAEVAQKILRVRPNLNTLADGHVMDSTGTLRRIQALVSIGHNITSIGRRLNILPANMHTLMNRDQVTARTARAVVKLYDELWNQPVHPTQWQLKSAAQRARNTAKRNGWLPPMAWDDETIDNPHHTPTLDEPTRNQQTQALAENVEFLFRTGESFAQIANRLNIQPSKLQSRLRDQGHAELVRRIKRQEAT